MFGQFDDFIMGLRSAGESGDGAAGRRAGGGLSRAGILFIGGLREAAVSFVGLVLDNGVSEFVDLNVGVGGWEPMRFRITRSPPTDSTRSVLGHSKFDGRGQLGWPR